MASSFPGSIDNFTDPLSNSSLSSPSHSGLHSDVNDAIEKIETYMGLVKVIPTGATNGTVSADGDVTIGNAVSSVTVSGAFSALYDSYRVVLNNVTMSNTSYATEIRVQMTSGGTASATNVYTYGIIRIDQGSGATATLYSAGTSSAIVGLGTGYTYATAFDCHSPFLAKITGFTGLGMFHYYNGYAGAGGACHTVEASYDGLKIFPSTGTLTGGTIRVYGYRN